MADRSGNRLLDLLPGDELRSLLASSRVVSLPHGQVVYRRNGPIPHVLFPTTGVFGVVVLMKGGEQVEGATVGREGMVGLPAFLGLDFHPLSVAVQVPGEAVRVSAAALLKVAGLGGALDRLLRRYTLFRLRCANQTGACNALHAVEERTARWLLMAHDRVGRDEFTITHEFLAELLGVRRQTVSVIAGALQRAGFIIYRRGVLRVLDREGLEDASCECYEVLKRLYDRIMGGADRFPGSSRSGIASPPVTFRT
jgi:CRP-like cAMP-binding protein